MNERFYITTPIYYVNDIPHIGHAYSTIAADALARYHRLRGQRTHFLTGTDEHGQKIEEAAKARGRAPKEFVDLVSVEFRNAWPKLLCQPDDFIRTTERRHIERAQALWNKCVEANDIYLGEHEGWYCVKCEAFYTEKELLAGNRCPIHEQPVARMKEPSYFFRLSRYAPRLLAVWEKYPEMILPSERRNEVVSFVRAGLKDLSVSRTSFSWGIAVPGDPKHVMYVWFDALANYLTALGDGELRETFWPPDVHLCGKDILRFHTVFWHAFLLSAGFSESQLPRSVFSHGFLTVNGKKIGKSMLDRGSIVEPLRLAEYFGPDEVRYFLLREIALGQDGDFSHQALINRIRAELAGTLGNLLNRTLGAFVVKHFDGKIPRPGYVAKDSAESELRERAIASAEEAARAWEAFEPHRALDIAMALAAAGNKYFDDRAPWSLAKQADKRSELATVVYYVLETLRVSSLLLWPALPAKMNALRQQLGLEPVSPQIGLDRWPLSWGGLAPRATVAPGAPLFRNITREDETKILADFQPKTDQSGPVAATNTENKAPGTGTKAPVSNEPAAQPVAGTTLSSGLIQYGDFEKIELKVGHVRSAERIPKKDKLMRLSVDLGEPSGPRTIIAGIALSYTPEQLVSKQIVVVVNLAPRDFGKGLVSHGMLLACGPSDSLSLVMLEKPMPAGTRVK